MKTLVLSEWSLSISRPAALPHLLAVLVQFVDPIHDENVKTVLSPAAYVDTATQAGWKATGKRTFQPTLGLEDGKWESGFAKSVVRTREAAQTKSGRSAEKVRPESLRAHADSLEAAIHSQKRLDRDLDGVECMDV